MIILFRLFFYILLSLSTRLAYNHTCFNETKVVYYLDTDIPANLPSMTTLIGGWQSATASMYIAKILLEEKMGVVVELWPTESENYTAWYEYDNEYPVTQYEWLQSGSVDWIIECWELTRYESEVEAVFDGSMIEEIGNLGTVGQMYLFVPGYTIEMYTGLGWYEALHDEEVVEIFLDDMLMMFDKYKNQTGFFKRYVNWTEGDPDRFTTESATDETNQTRPFILAAKVSYQMNKDLWDRMHVLNLSATWDLWMVDSEQTLSSLVEEMMDAGINFLAQLYAPAADLGQFGLEKINFPFPQVSTCYEDKTCEEKLDTLFKTMNVQAALDFPEVENFLVNIRLSNIDVNSIIADSTRYENSTMQDSVCTWLIANEHTWSDWLVEINRELPVRLNLSFDVMICVVVATLTLIVVTNGALWYLIKNEHKPLIKAVSPEFLALAALSGIVIALAGLLWTFDDFEYGLTICSLRWILSCSGNSLLFASLSLKTWRVYTIFNTTQGRRSHFRTNCQLYRYIGLVFIPVIALLVWKVMAIFDQGLTFRIADDGVEYQYECPDTTAGNYLVGLQLLLALTTLVLCFLARDIPDDFQEIVHIMYLCVFTMLIIGFSVLVFKAAGETPSTRSIIGCLSHFCVAVVIEISVLGRTMYLLVSGKAEREAETQLATLDHSSDV